MKEYSSIGMFFIKLVLVSVAFIAIVSIFLPNFNNIQEKWKEYISERENRALLLSFIQNPVALTISGERDLERKNYTEAALKFELAVGLLEMHGASPTTMQPYKARLLDARRMAEASTEKGNGIPRQPTSKSR